MKPNLKPTLIVLFISPRHLVMMPRPTRYDISRRDNMALGNLPDPLYYQVMNEVETGVPLPAIDDVKDNEIHLLATEISRLDTSLTTEIRRLDNTIGEMNVSLTTEVRRLDDSIRNLNTSLTTELRELRLEIRSLVQEMRAQRYVVIFHTAFTCCSFRFTGWIARTHRSKTIGGWRVRCRQTRTGSGGIASSRIATQTEARPASRGL